MLQDSELKFIYWGFILVCFRASKKNLGSRSPFCYVQSPPDRTVDFKVQFLILVEFWCTSISQNQSYITTDGQSASPSWWQAPIRARDKFVFLLEIFFRPLWVCYFVTPSLTRGPVCNLLLLLVFASAVPLWSESRRTQDYILFSQFLRLPQPGGPGFRIYIPPGTGWPR
jgi:hypothetical protein